jgi:hypothetical protein
MRHLTKLALILATVTASGLVSAETLDFEMRSLGLYALLDDADISITYTGKSGTFEVVESFSPGSPISGHALLSKTESTDYDASPFKATFAIPVNYFQIGVGDWAQDVDNTRLDAYDAQGKLLATSFFVNPISNNGGGWLTVSTQTDIAYVLFRDEKPYPGAVYWDNITYALNPVPEPETYAMLLAGLGLLAAAGKRRS